MNSLDEKTITAFDIAYRIEHQMMEWKDKFVPLEDAQKLEVEIHNWMHHAEDEQHEKILLQIKIGKALEILEDYDGDMAILNQIRSALK